MLSFVRRTLTGVACLRSMPQAYWHKIKTCVSNYKYICCRKSMAPSLYKMPSQVVILCNASKAYLGKVCYIRCLVNAYAWPFVRMSWGDLAYRNTKTIYLLIYCIMCTQLRVQHCYWTRSWICDIVFQALPDHFRYYYTMPRYFAEYRIIQITSNTYTGGCLLAR